MAKRIRTSYNKYKPGSRVKWANKPWVMPSRLRLLYYGNFLGTGKLIRDFGRSSPLYSDIYYGPSGNAGGIIGLQDMINQTQYDMQIPGRIQ